MSTDTVQTISQDNLASANEANAAVGPTPEYQAAYRAGLNAIAQAPKKEMRVYYHSVQSCHFLFTNGKSAIFINHFYKTDNAHEIDYLDNEIDNGNPFIRRATEEEARAQLQTPESLAAELEAFYFRKFLQMQQEQAAVMKKDAGNYEAGKVIPASSTDVAVAMAGGSGKPVITPVNPSAAALLAKLKAGQA